MAVRRLKGLYLKSKGKYLEDEYLYPWQTIMLSLSNFIEKENIPIPNAYMQAVSALFPMLGEFGSADVKKKAHLLVDSVMGFDSVLTLLTLATKKKQLLLVVEDIQWIDSIDLPFMRSEQGVNEAGTFQLICRDCDSKIFRQYEDPTAYQAKPTGQMLAQIAMKDYLQMIYKRLHEESLYKLMGTELGVPANYVDHNHEIISLDLLEYNTSFSRAQIFQRILMKMF